MEANKRGSIKKQKFKNVKVRYAHLKVEHLRNAVETLESPGGVGTKVGTVRKRIGVTDNVTP